MSSSHLDSDKDRSPLQLGAISFMNTLPIYHGFESQLALPPEIHYGNPAELNSAMEAKQLDISPVSSVYYLRNQEKLQLLPGLSVSSYGSVERCSLLFRSTMGT